MENQCLLFYLMTSLRWASLLSIQLTGRTSLCRQDLISGLDSDELLHHAGTSSMRSGNQHQDSHGFWAVCHDQVLQAVCSRSEVQTANSSETWIWYYVPWLEHLVNHWPHLLWMPWWGRWHTCALCMPWNTIGTKPNIFGRSRKDCSYCVTTGSPRTSSRTVSSWIQTTIGHSYEEKGLLPPSALNIHEL